MSSNRSWMQRRFDERNNITDEYKNGVKEFIDFAIKRKDTHGNIRCPCNECGNLSFHQPERVTYHLYRYGIMESYTTWDLHMETHRSRVQARPSSSNTGHRDDDIFSSRVSGGGGIRTDKGKGKVSGDGGVGKRYVVRGRGDGGRDKCKVIGDGGRDKFKVTGDSGRGKGYVVRGKGNGGRGRGDGERGRVDVVDSDSDSDCDSDYECEDEGLDESDDDSSCRNLSRLWSWWFTNNSTYHVFF
ncbi:hypothetical protein POM88_021369 [Heracleum sosnowskyi]|uniref:Transposase-associated domain-containing protein n=1 Tax=Heracleum sosnowskyi TaxID=360622 RepID=A0AAD8ID87_9APIA|nr:hypothetical protein POM88_021369 [Heracleum sosnowskyi]